MRMSFRLVFFIFCMVGLVFYSFAALMSKEEKISIMSIEDLKKASPGIEYTKIHDQRRLNFSVFPIASSEDSTYATPIIPETFVLKIPKASIYSDAGYIIVNGKFMVAELIWPWSPIRKECLSFNNFPKAKKIKGRVVVLAQEGSHNYYHWMAEIVPKLSLLKDIPYDWVYLPSLDLPFQVKSLQLLGIDLKKVIEAKRDTYIEADEVIVPSYVSKSCYTPDWVAEYLKEKLAKPVIDDSEHVKFAPKVFISREKASYRHITNEDEIFDRLRLLGYEKYCLEELDFVEQIKLFAQAENIVAAHGAGLTNIVFCRPGTKVAELFQELEDDTYCYLSQTMKLDYICLKTTEFKSRPECGYNDTEISPKLFEKFIVDNLDKF